MVWWSSTELQVMLGADAVVMVRDGLVFNSFATELRRSITALEAYESPEAWMSTEQQMRPFISINAPVEIGACGALRLDARQTNATGGRQLKLRWGIVQVPCDEVEYAIMAQLSSLGPTSARIGSGCGE